MVIETLNLCKYFTIIFQKCRVDSRSRSGRIYVDHQQQRDYW
jgi:hypothetical protein